MPLQGLKLLSVIVERNQAFVMILRKLQLIPVLFEYFQVGHSKFNSSTVKIIRSIVASREIDIEELISMQMIQKINGIMAEVIKDNSEWCSDHLLVIMNEILHLAAELKKEKPESTTPQKVFDQLLVNFKSFSKLLKASDVVSIIRAHCCSRLLKERASICLRLFTSPWYKEFRRARCSRLPKHRWSSFYLRLSSTNKRLRKIC
jgi:hypothetical protein